MQVLYGYHHLRPEMHFVLLPSPPPTIWERLARLAFFAAKGAGVLAVLAVAFILSPQAFIVGSIFGLAFGTIAALRR